MQSRPSVLIVDDEKHTRDGLRSLLENEYDVYVAPDIAGAINVLEREQIDVLLTDLRLGSEDGMTLIDRALKMPRPPACIMMTAYGSVDVAVEAMKRGAYDFVTKPLNLDKVELLIARAVQGRKLEQENRALREQVDERYGLENIWGDSAALHEVLDTIRQVAPFFGDFELEPEARNHDSIRLNWREKGVDQIFGPHQISDGTLRAIALITLLLQPESSLPRVIVIDEPELGLHPYAIGVLASLVKRASHHCQVILATQSPALLDEFEPEDVVVVDRDSQESKFRRLGSDQLDSWLEEYSFSEAWEKNVFGGGPH